jgi:dihydropteroate synthase
MFPLQWQVRGRVITIERPLVMGILNVTPDSFSDGGQFAAHDAAVTRALQMVQESVDIIDVGGESTRPYSEPVPLDEELRRVVPVVKAIAKQSPVLISVDTSKAEVARQALDAGASIVNDVTALGDGEMPDVVRKSAAGAILMHMQGTPQTMQINPHYDFVVCEVHDFLAARINALVKTGIPRECLAIDPGIGFGKTNEHSLTLLANLDRFLDLGRPICLGVSRKGFIGKITGRERPDRAAGSVAVACHAMTRGAAHIVRVHDVAPTVDAVKMIDAVTKAHKKP